MTEAIIDFLQQTGVYMLAADWKALIMIAVACVLAYLAIVKGFEPLLLLPIAFGMLLTNLPGAEIFHEALFANGHVQWRLFGGGEVTQALIDQLTAEGASQAVINQLNYYLSLETPVITPGLLDYLYLGVKLCI